MDIVRRVGSILLKPREEWAKIKAEPTTASKFFISYVIILAAIPPVFEFLRRVLIERVPMYGHWPVDRALGPAIIGYAVNLTSVCLFALIINQLAPSFNSTKNMVNALKLAGYSLTPAWLAGVFNIVSGLWGPIVMASLYGLFILFLGIETPMMETPKDKRFGYVILSGITAAALSIISWITRIVFAVR